MLFSETSYAFRTEESLIPWPNMISYPSWSEPDLLPGFIEMFPWKELCWSIYVSFIDQPLTREGNDLLEANTKFIFQGFLLQKNSSASGHVSFPPGSPIQHAIDGSRGPMKQWNNAHKRLVIPIKGKEKKSLKSTKHFNLWPKRY